MADEEAEEMEAGFEMGRDCCKSKLKKLLKRLKDECDEVTIFLQSGSKCCRITGCICDVDDCFVELFDGDGCCDRTYILLDCICAVKNCVDNNDCEY